MELTNMTNEELQSIIENANKIIHDRAIDERRTYANAIVENIHKLIKSGGSIYIQGAASCLDDWNIDLSFESTLDEDSICVVDKSGTLTIKDLYFERS